MADPLAVVSLVVAAGALGVSFRALRVSEAEHAARTAEREARPVLGLAVEPSNVQPDGNGVIHTDATIVNVILRVRITNTGDKEAGRTQLAAWAPVGIESTFDWVEASGVELQPRATAAHDPSVTLRDDEGRDLPSKRLDRTLDSVPLIGEVIHLRVPSPVTMHGRGSVPLRLTVRTDGSQPATVAHTIRLVHPG